MSKAPETIYIVEIPDDAPDYLFPFYFTERQGRNNYIGYVRSDIAYGYASEVERLKARIESMFSLLTQKDSRIQSLESTLRHVSRNASVMTAHEIETMARDALTKEG